MKLAIDLHEYDVISLDIFDTLWFRTVAKPIDIFEHVWKKAVLDGITNIDITPYEFLKLRVEMERRARSHHAHREVVLEDIYDKIPSYIAQSKQKLMQIELETEMRSGYLNPDMYKLIKEANKQKKKVVLLSDMYLNKMQIIQLLESAQFDIKLIDEIIVSCEKKCSKQEGALYQELSSLFPQVHKSRILHIGDNKYSDYEQAVKHGLHAFHYDVIPTKMNSIYDYEKIRHNIPQPEILSLRKIAAQQVKYTDDKEKTAYEIGASIVGPFLSLFVSHVVKRMQQLNINNIYPLMREGYLLSELLKREIEDQQLSINVKSIYTSRKVSYIGAIEKIDREEIENIIGVRNLTIGELITIFGLDEEQFREAKQYFDTKLKVSHSLPFDNYISLKEYIIDRLLEEENKNKIQDYVIQERKLYVEYLEQEIDNLMDAATIDIGCVGRIQEWTEKALRFEQREIDMKHFLGMGVTEDRVYNGMHIEGYTGTYAESIDMMTTIHRTPDVLEKLISVCEGSTIGYRRVENKIVPLQDQSVKNERLTNIVFSGILNFQKYWFYFRQQKPEIVDEVINNRRGCLEILHRMIDIPTLKEVELIMSFEADTNFGTNHKQTIITKENLELIEKKGIEFIDKCNVSYSYQNSNIVWPKGLITLKDEFYYLRKALKSSAGNEIIKNMQEVVEDVYNQGIKEVALYGAGENGRQFYFICKLYNIKVSCFIDRKESLWGKTKEGVIISGLDEAIGTGNRNFIITSLFSISEIKDYIEKSFKEIENVPKIFYV